MLFNSIDFAVFLPSVFILYWFIARKNLKLRNSVIVAASYVFYAWWDWRFLSLLFISTMVDFIIGLRLQKTEKSSRRKALLWISICVNIGMLGFFKYCDFFVDNFVAAFSFFGTEIKANRLNIVLPVGISFYTFQTLSYTIDIYKHKFEPVKDFIAFSAFVSFFPQLVAGPVERARHLLPQFYTMHIFDYEKAVDGMRRILWGFFKKLVIADNCAEFANCIFDNSSAMNGSTLLLGAVFFTFQIYGDFSGYSDIAIGTAKLFGFDLMQNFAYPYFSRDIAEFWRRWHISLTSWFRDYIYIPLGGSRGSAIMNIRNIFIIFIVSGLWHGANWTFVLWGVLNALYFLPLFLTRNNRKNMDIAAKGKTLPTIKEFFQMLSTFILVVFGWILFRAENIDSATAYFSKMFSSSLFSIPEVIPKSLIIIILLFILVEWIGREDKYAIEKIPLKWKKIYRYALYYTILALIFWFGGEEQQFIYFQF